MKKRVLSLLMALTLCFTMLPTAALAQQTGAADVYTTGEDTAVQDKQAAEAVRAAQALIDALPDEVTADNAEEIEAQLIALDEALAALTEEQYAQLDMTRYEALCAALAAQVSLTAERGGEHADHPICGDASCKESSHQLPVGESWTAIHDAGELEGITKAGYYYLTGPVALTSTWYPEDGVVLCLNGQTITLNDGDRGNPASVIRVKGGVTFTLCDCQNTGTVTHGTNGDGDTYTGSGVWVDDDRYTTGPASFVLYGGSISGNTVAETMEDGAGVHLGYNAHFTMHGGTISGNSTTASDGGGVYMGDSNASFTMTGGEITDNSSGLSGGGVYAANGTFTMTGGTIGDNTVTGSGAGVYAAADCTLTMNGDARIAGNKATGNSARGGGVYVAGTCNMSGNAAITGNSAAYGGVYVNSGAAFTMNGGSITANTAKYGGGVWTATAFEVSGAPKIIDNTDSTDSTGSTKNNVYLSLGTTITIADALAPEARIGVTTGHENSIAPGTYVTVATGAEKGCTADNFSADKGGSCAIKAEGDNVNLYNGLPQEHPICGAAHKDINGHTGACADVTWTAWDGVSDITYDANNTAYVYLRDNAERDSALEIANGYTLYLCLSGHSLTKNKTGKSVIKVGDNATLSLCDCSDAQSGKLTHGTTASGLKYTGHGVSLGYRSTLNMYGGSITGNRADTGGGVSLASEYSYAKFNMYGGSITNNAATNGDGGGGVHNLFGTFTMYGGSITGNSADTRCGGGGVYLARMGEFVMKGGEITGNTAKNGGGVYTAVNGNTGLTVSGDAAITGNSNTAGKDENVYLVSGKTIEIGADGLGEKASIGVTTADTITTGSYVTVANGAENGYTDGNIFSDAGGAYCTLQEGDNVNLYNGQPHRHPICGEVCGHTGGTHADADWTAWDGVSDIVYDANNTAYVYLTGDAERDTTLTVEKGYTLYLCLNGYSLTMKAEGEVISVTGSFTLTDCRGGDDTKPYGKITHAAGVDGRGVRIKSAADASLSETAVFTMYGGEISGNKVSDSGSINYGGGVRVSDPYSTFTMLGGIITNNEATNGGGGGVYIGGGRFEMSGSAVITRNKTASSLGGGGVFMNGSDIVYALNEFIMSGNAVISENTATNGNGGGVYMNSAPEVTMNGGSITGNTAANNGGGVYAFSGTFTMNDGTIAGNKATAKNGGGVYANGSTAFTMTGGTIGGSTAADANTAKYGGGVYVKNGTFTMSGGKVTGNSASKDGGGVRLDKGTFNMSGSAVISRNTADGYGGGVDANDGSFTMSGGSITGNNAIRGGGVELTGSGTMTVSGSVQITNNWQKGTLNSASGVYEKGSSGKPENLYLYSGKTVAIGTDGLNAGAHIGVSTEDWPDPGSPVKIATNATNEESHYTAIFTPDAEEADYKITKENDSVYLSAHEHTWRYALKSGTKDTISATCEECNWNGGSVTIKAPEHTVYGDGKDQSVQIENTNWLPEYPANAVSYRKGTETIEAPTDAGSYTGVLTIGGVEATVDYTIGRKTVSAGDVTFSHTHTTYDGTQKNVADFLVVTVDGKTLTPGTDYVVFGTTSASDFEEEGYNARIALQGNYEGTVPFRWHIDPREVELEPVNAADRRYGDGKGNVTLRVTNAVGNDRVSVTVTGGDDLSVGTHSVTATALDRPEYTLPADAAKRTLTYSVGKGKVNQVNLTMYVYNNVAKTHTYDFSQALPALADGLTYGTCSYTGKTNLNANVVSGIGFNGSVLTFNTGRISSRPDTLILSYTATVKSDNYEDLKLLLYVQTKDKTVADLPEADITMEGWSYGQTPNQPSVANLPAGAVPTFTYKDANGAEFTPTKTTDAGAYTVTVRYETEDTVHTGTRSFTVAPKTLTAEDIGEYGPSGIIPNKTYDGGTGIDLTGLGVKKAALVGTDENLIISGSAEFAGANAGVTTLVFTTDGELCEIPGVPGKASNYQIAAGLTKPFAARIDQRPIAFTVDSVSKRHGSDTADVRVTFTGVAGNNKSGLVSGETLVQGVDYDVTAAFTRTTMGEDNNVTVTVTLKDTETARNYTLAGGGTVTGVTGTITKAAAPVIPEQTLEIYSNAKTRYPIDLTKDWPAGAPALSDYIHDRNSPYLEAEELSDLLYNNASYMIPGPDDWNGTIYLNAKAFTADVGTDLGVLKVTLRSENYDDATIRVRVKVKAKTEQALSVSIEGWTYGSTPSQPVYGAPGGTVSGPDITYTSRDGATSYGATAPTDAGDYTVTIRYESIDTIWSGSADFTISKKQITPPAADTTVFTYTADEQTYALAASPDYTVSDNTVQTNVGDYTVLVSLNDTANTEWADGTTGEKTYTFSIGPAALTVTALDKEILVGQSAPDLSDPAEGTDYRVEGLLGADVLTGVTLTYGETPDTGRMGSYAIHAAAAQANYDVACVSGTLTIRKYAAPVLADIPFSCKYTLTGEQTVDVSGLVPGAEGYTLGAAAGETAIVSGAAVDAGGVVTYTLTGAGKAGDSVTLPVTISSARYEDAAVNVVITLLPRDNQAALRVTGGTTVVYGETLQLGTSGGSGAGAVTYAVTDGTGKATIDANGVLTPVQVGAVTVTATKAGDDAYNDVTSAAVTVTITKATPTGVPGYTPVTGRGKTLRDAALTIEGGSLSLKDGTLEWVDKDGNVLPDDTVIEAGKSYKWRFTPADGNYTAISGEIVLYSPAEDDTGHGNSHNYRTIMVTVRGNGSVSPSGWANVPIGSDQTFTITPDKGYAVAKVLIDGQSVGAVTSYTFRGITEGHTIEVIFMKANGNPQTGVDMGQRTVGCGR